MDGGREVAEQINQYSGMSSVGRSAAERAVGHMKGSIESGKHWYIALLEAMALWAAPDEVFQGHRYSYLIAGEAFDWLLLAERLCEAVDGLIPQAEKERLLFESEPPIDLSTAELRGILGSSKYSALLNYWYGVEVERALVTSIEEAVQKERLASGRTRRRDVSEEVFLRVYGFSRKALLKAFCAENGLQANGALSTTEQKEFTYWLFKYRLKKHDKARVASDTRRGIERLRSAPGPRRDGWRPTSTRRPGHLPASLASPARDT